MQKTKVLVAVKSEALARVIQHVLHGQAGIAGIDFADSELELMEQARRLRPELIIVNNRLFGRNPDAAAFARLRRVNPHSKLILTCNVEEFSHSIDPALVDARVLDEALVQQLPAIARQLTNQQYEKNSLVQQFCFVMAIFLLSFTGSAFAQAGMAPSTYTAYSGTDTKTIPAAPALGAANSVITDPTFGSRILRVTDQSTKGGESFISTDAGFHRAWNANSTAIKLTGPSGDGYWMDFNPNTFQVGTGSSQPALHSVPFGATWEWSTVDPDIIYFLQGNQIAKYNKSTGVSTNLAGPSTSDGLGYMAVVIGLDNWVCAAAGSGQQDSYSKVFCINPTSPSTTKLIDVYNKTINGVAQGDPNWPTSAAGQVIGIHDISGGTGATWLEVTFHQQSWGADGGAVFNFATNTWSLVTASDPYWSGHVSMGNGAYANASGSVNGSDSRGLVVRNPSNLMNASDYNFVGQPPDTKNGWCDADHSSWLNSVNNPNAPILSSRYTISANCKFAYTGEIIAAAVDGSKTVWRFAHNHNGGSVCYYAQSFAQISNDGHWALFSSYWDGALGADTSFGCATRIDTFVVDLLSAGASSTTATSSPTTTGTTTTTTSTGTTTTSSTGTTTSSSTPSTAAATSGWTRAEQNSSAVAYTGTWYPNTGAFNSGGNSVLAVDAGSRTTFSFTGTSARWIGYQDQWSGIANVYLDGTSVGQIDTYAASSQAQAVLYSTPALAAGTHTLAIEASGKNDSTSGGAWVWVDAFDYAASSTAAPSPVSAPTSSGTTSSSSTPTSSSTTSSGTASAAMGYGVIPAGTGTAVLSSFYGSELASEAAVPGTTTATKWMLYAEKNAAVSTGVAIANPNGTVANLTLSFSNGTQASLQIPANGHHAAYIDQLSSNFPASFLGTLAIQSDVPVALLALRETMNSAGEYIMATIPLSSSVSTLGGSEVFPIITDGGGYNSELILVNSASTVSAGTLQFSSTVSTNLGVNTQFAFNIPAGGVWKVQTSGTAGSVTSNYASILMSTGSPMPNATAMIRLSQNGNLISETAVPAQTTLTQGLVFGSLESNRRTGLAMVNPNGQSVSVTLTARDSNGNTVAPAKTFSLGAAAQTSAFLDELIGGLPVGFEGTVSLTATSPVNAISVRGTTNSSNQFLMSMLPIVNLNQLPSGPQYFPQVVNGDSFQTGFLLTNPGASLPKVSFFGDAGQALTIPQQ